MSKNASKQKIKIRREMFKFEEMVKTAESLTKVEDHLTTHQLAMDLCYFLEEEGLTIPEYAKGWWNRNKPKAPTVDGPQPTNNN